MFSPQESTTAASRSTAAHRAVCCVSLAVSVFLTLAVNGCIHLL